MRKRFTIDGSDALEARLSNLCHEVQRKVTTLIPTDQLEAILLGGGYGRGEGGVLKATDGDYPYNDLEFYVCIRGSTLLNERLFRQPLHELAEEMSKTATIEVEFKITSVEKLRKSAVTMFVYDLAAGHRVVHGPTEIFHDHQIHAKDIPLFEATRLLMNRCSGLLFAEQRLRRNAFDAEAADFVGRNQAKAQLAFGDVVLATLGQYHSSCRERHERLKKLSTTADAKTVSGLPMAKLLCHHAVATEFKLHPQRKTGTAETFLPLQSELSVLGLQLWLWLESRRLGTQFGSARDYTFSRMNKCPETNPLKNILINARRFGMATLLRGERTAYPRQRLLHTLPLLLWERGTIHDPVLLKKVQKELKTNAGTFERLVNAYHTIWKDYN